MKKILMAALIIFPLISLADPAPFGLEIGKATLKEVKSKYNARKSGINKYSGGEMYALSGIDFDGLQNVEAIFSTDGRLLAILTTLPKEKFNYLLESLAKKYQLISKNTPFVGNKVAKLTDGNTEIILEAPHMSFVMRMNYINKDLWKAYEEQSGSEEQEKQRKEESQL